MYVWVCVLHRRTSAGKRFGSAPAVHSLGVRKFTHKPLPLIRRRHLHLHGQQLPRDRWGLGRPRGLGWVCVCVLKCIDHRLSLFFRMFMFKCVCIVCVIHLCIYWCAFPLFYQTARTRITNPPQDQSVIKGTKATMTCGVTHDPSVSVRCAHIHLTANNCCKHKSFAFF